MVKKLGIVAVGMAGLLVIAAACGGDESTPTPTRPSTATASPTATQTQTATATETGTATATGTATEPSGAPTPAAPNADGFYQVEADDFYFEGPSVAVKGGEGTPAVMVLPAGPVKFEVKNTGKVPHTLHVTGGSVDKATEAVQPGGTATLDLGTLAAGAYTFKCDFHPNMTGTLTVVP